MGDSIRSTTRRAWIRAAASLIAIAATAKGAAREARGGTLLVLGDSLSAEYGLARGTGWVELLAKRLADAKRPWRVANASISGETTAGGLARIADLLVRERPSLVIVELGGNDALRGLELSATEANLREIVRRSRAAGARVLLVGVQIPPNYGRTYTEAFGRVFAQVAASEKTALAPSLVAGLERRPDLFQADRIHPTEQAQALLLENVWHALKPLLG